MERFDLVKRNKSPELLGIPCVPISKDLGFPIGLFYHTHASRLHLFLSTSCPKEGSGQVALHGACSRGHLECAKALLGAGADINKQNNRGETPLMWAAANGEIEVVRELLKRGAKKDPKDNRGKTAYDTTSNEEIKALLR